MPGKLSTHVLDLTTGKPAAGMLIELWTYGDEPRLMKSARTNGDGRTDSLLLESAEMQPGTYELNFFVRDYFEERRLECPFLDEVPVRFQISDPGAEYHVPLLVSPWAYSTYRGS
jgi:5-hydroxyisourate hydrolase